MHEREQSPIKSSLTRYWKRSNRRRPRELSRSLLGLLDVRAGKKSHGDGEAYKTAVGCGETGGGAKVDRAKCSSARVTPVYGGVA